jgi:hypothetical protein
MVKSNSSAGGGDNNYLRDVKVTHCRSLGTSRCASLGGVDAVPLCLGTKDPDELIRTVKLLEPSFGRMAVIVDPVTGCVQATTRAAEAQSQARGRAASTATSVPVYAKEVAPISSE